MDTATTGRLNPVARRLGRWGAAGAVAVAVGLAVALWRLVVGRSPARQWAIAATVGILAQVAAFLVLPEDPGYLAPAVPMTWLLLALALPLGALASVAAVVAAGCVVALPGTADMGTTTLADAQARRDELGCAAALLRAVDELPAGAVVVTRGFMYPLAAREPRALLPDVQAAGPDRPDTVPGRVDLPGGQVLLYEVTAAVEQAPVAYRLAGVAADLPVLTPVPRGTEGNPLVRPECR